MSRPPFTFYEFFAGGGMARLGLGEGWRCLFANDFDPVKAATYRANFEGDHFHEGDVWALSARDLPGRADLAWASSPCQDFSLAGARAGLAGGRSSAFLGFWRLIEALDDEGRAPRIVVLENVAGLLSSRGGEDFAAVCAALTGRGYRYGVVEIDAAAFLPQSRPRVFVVATRDGVLPAALRTDSIRWRIEPPPARNTTLADVLEPDGAVPWRSAAQTRALVAQLSPQHRARLDAAVAGNGRIVAAVYRRIRTEAGRKVQRAELRLDGLAGCLRTPGGGSSRQLLLVAEAGALRSRWLTAREGARLMGLCDDYVLPRSETAALKVVGDGVAAPVVRALAAQLLEPLLSAPALAAAE